MSKNKKITMACGGHEYKVTIAHAEKIISIASTNEKWEVKDKGYKIKDGKIISAGSAGSDSGSDKEG